MGQEGITKDQEEIWWKNGLVSYLNYGDVFIFIYTSKFIKLYTLSEFSFLYVSYTSINLFNKKGKRREGKGKGQEGKKRGRREGERKRPGPKSETRVRVSDLLCTCR